MKKFVISIVVAIAACGCGALRQVHDRYVDTYFLDFRPYTEAGFFISPNPYTGVYSPVGDLLVKVVPAVYPKDKKSMIVNTKGGSYDDGIYSRPAESDYDTKTITEEISPSELLDIAVGEALKLGANGISNFRCSAIYDTIIDRNGSHKKFSHYEISGLCISIDK